MGQLYYLDVPQQDGWLQHVEVLSLILQACLVSDLLHILSPFWASLHCIWWDLVNPRSFHPDSISLLLTACAVEHLKWLGGGNNFFFFPFCNNFVINPNLSAGWLCFLHHPSVLWLECFRRDTSRVFRSAIFHFYWELQTRTDCKTCKKYYLFFLTL